MMSRHPWRNDEQGSRAVRAVLRLKGLEHYWSPTGPTLEARKLLSAIVERVPRCKLTGKPRLLFLAAWELWAPGIPTEAGFGELVWGLDTGSAQAVLTLALATKVGPDAVDEWLGVYDPRAVA